MLLLPFAIPIPTLSARHFRRYSATPSINILWTSTRQSRHCATSRALIHGQATLNLYRPQRALPINDHQNTRNMVTVHEGDKVTMESHGKVVITPFSAPHNFGPASSLDTTVYTCERPGGDPGPGVQIDTTKAVQEWFTFMQPHQIQHVIILMDANELEAYTPPGLIAAYEEHGIRVHHIPLNSENSFSKIMAQLRDIEASGEKVTAHCTHGMGRSGRVAAGWLVERHGLTPEQATDQTLQAAREHGVERMGAVGLLEKWMTK